MISKFRQYIATGDFAGKVICIQGDLREIPLDKATIIVTYLLPEAMTEISTRLAGVVIDQNVTLVCNTWGLSADTLLDGILVERHEFGNSVFFTYRQGETTGVKIKA